MIEGRGESRGTRKEKNHERVLTANGGGQNDTGRCPPGLGVAKVQ